MLTEDEEKNVLDYLYRQATGMSSESFSIKSSKNAKEHAEKTYKSLSDKEKIDLHNLLVAQEIIKYFMHMSNQSWVSILDSGKEDEENLYILSQQKFYGMSRQQKLEICGKLGLRFICKKD